MPRMPRIVIPEVAHHIVQRGNNRQDVFLVDGDRNFYLSVLRDQSQRHGFEVLGYCLMSNHVHVIGIPKAGDSLRKVIGRTDFIYTQYFNRRQGRSGHLWQARFYSCALDEPHLAAALAYVERNPVRAQAVKVAWHYPWSSAQAHLEGQDPTGLLCLERWRELFGEWNWRAVLSRRGDALEAGQLRSHTRRGRPLGSDSFIRKVEKRLGRRVRPLPEGWPKGKKRKAQGKIRKSGG